MGSNIYFETVVPTTKGNLFHQHMIEFVNKLDFNYRKYQTNGTSREESYKDKFLFPMKEFVSFGKDSQSMLYM